ncbi:chromate transporter [Cohnella sp. AR92]|uniref:chromate transporter n=1 Tax=Cohnella sp. AR92 TaxID=648716 RepID=UPI000F8E22B9|nr:chromate transporter [Cohnella sp. AR92]RUS46643.1 chromate transporter [Cohnella sp. AR92]
MLESLILTFLKIGLLSFGGGYAVIPAIHSEAEGHGWLDESALAHTVSIAAMSPGSIATNIASLIGYRIDGVPGALLSTVSIILPSVAITILIAIFFYRMRESKWMRYVLYSLRPIITMLILYAAIKLLGVNSASITDWTAIATVLIIGGSVYAMLRSKLHPVLIIVASGLTGIILF